MHFCKLLSVASCMNGWHQSLILLLLLFAMHIMPTLLFTVIIFSNCDFLRNNVQSLMIDNY